MFAFLLVYMCVKGNTTCCVCKCHLIITLCVGRWGQQPQPLTLLASPTLGNAWARPSLHHAHPPPTHPHTHTHTDTFSHSPSDSLAHSNSHTHSLYQITVYFPAEAGGQSYLPLLYHNDTYVMCYFDSGDLVGTAAADPGWRLANACADINKAQTSTSRRHASAASAPLVYRRDSYDRMWARADEPMGVVRVQERAALVARYDEESGEFGVDPSLRRGVSEISWESKLFESLDLSSSQKI